MPLARPPASPQAAVLRDAGPANLAGSGLGDCGEAGGRRGAHSGGGVREASRCAPRVNECPACGAASECKEESNACISWPRHKGLAAPPRAREAPRLARKAARQPFIAAPGRHARTRRLQQGSDRRLRDGARRGEGQGRARGRVRQPRRPDGRWLPIDGKQQQQASPAELRRPPTSSAAHRCARVFTVDPAGWEVLAMVRAVAERLDDGLCHAAARAVSLRR